MTVYFWVLIALTFFLWIIWELWRSPKGYENEHGFHIEKEEIAEKIKAGQENIGEIKKIQHVADETVV